MVYVLITFDNWPAMAKPMLAESPYYLIYFLPFVIANALFFFPIPIAVIFDSFRVHTLLLIRKTEDSVSLATSYLPNTLSMSRSNSWIGMMTTSSHAENGKCS